jgi:hypothetical protein
MSRSALAPTHSLTQWEPGALSLDVHRAGREADHSPSSSADVKTAWSYTFTSPIRLHGVVLSWSTGTTLPLPLIKGISSIIVQWHWRWNKLNGKCTRVVWKVRVLILLLRVGTLWRCGEFLFRCTSLGKRFTSYNAPPTSRKRAAQRLPQTSGG